MIIIFSNRLRQLRENRGLTQEELAKKLNLTQSTIAYYKNGRKMPTLENAILLANIFDTSLDYLFGSYNKNPTSVNPFLDKLSDEINALSPESQKDLEDYIRFLKFKDMGKHK